MRLPSSRTATGRAPDRGALPGAKSRRRPRASDLLHVAVVLLLRSCLSLRLCGRNRSVRSGGLTECADQCARVVCVEADGVGLFRCAERASEGEWPVQLQGHRGLAAHDQVEDPVLGEGDQTALGVAPVDPDRGDRVIRRLVLQAPAPSSPRRSVTTTGQPPGWSPRSRRTWSRYVPGDDTR